MIKDSFHFKIVAMSYDMPVRKVRRRAKKLGIKGEYLTNEQAFDVANYTAGGKMTVQVIRIHEETLIIPSKSNFLPLEQLPQWPI